MRRALGLIGLLLLGGVCWLLAVWPPPFWYATHFPAQTAFMSMRGGAPKYRPVPLDSIAPSLQQAAIIGEDNNFATHGGIDYLALAQAIGYRRPTFAWSNARDRQALVAVLPQAWSRRDKLRGASTITQQLAKNLYLSASRNPLRKVKEAVIAWRLESALGKRRIMELYLNIVELGDGVWGAEAASREYFGRSALALTREQAAALAGSLPFPRTSNPGHRPGRMRWRQDLILRRMRGEAVEVPKMEEESPAETADSTLAPADTAPAAPPFTADSGAVADTAAADTTPATGESAP
jgi:monofunctional biosynthetic peptidoglycan transglycosylase